MPGQKNKWMSSLLSRFFGIVWFLLLASLLPGCSGDDEKGPDNRGRVYLIDSELKSEFPINQLRAIGQIFGFSGLTNLISSDIAIYKITYQTRYKGAPLVASGIIAVPQSGTRKGKIILAQRGTIFADTEAPSVTPALSGFELFSALGYITVIPDLIGFGASRQTVHPYYDFLHTSGASVDMMLAAFEFLKEEKIQYEEEMLMFGYSQGGYSAMATLKAVEENPSSPLKFKGVVAAAGGYRINGVMQHIIGRETYSSNAFLVNILYAYNVTNNWNRPLTFFFQEPHASLVPTLLDGTQGATQINRHLPTRLDQLFNLQLLTTLRSGSEQLITNAFEENSVHNWKPNAQLLLLHAPADEIIPIGNSEETAQQLQRNGARNVRFQSISGNSHVNAVVPAVEAAVTFFESLR